MWGISIHAPRVGSDRIQDAMTGPVADISIHAPRVGSDGQSFDTETPATVFLSTLPAWGATLSTLDDDPAEEISIHAPRVGSDPR